MSSVDLTQTRKWRAARDAWRQAQTGYRARLMDYRDQHGWATSVLPGRRKTHLRLGTLLVMRRRRYGTVTVDGSGMTLEGVATWAAQAGDDYYRQVVQIMDDEAGRFAFRVWRTWPVKTGWSKSSLELDWQQVGSGDIKVRFVARAPYTFVARGTRTAWAAARKAWAGVRTSVSARALRVQS